VPSNSGGQMHLDHALTLDQVLDYLEQMHRVRKETGMHVRLTNPLPYCSVWESHPHLRYLVESSTCTAGRSIIQVGPNGEVKPCPMISNSYGNILEEGLDIVWQRMSEWSEDKYVPETCKPCDLVTICRGACRAEAERMVGELEDKHPYSVRPVKLDKTEYYNQLEIGTRIVTAKDLRARKESEEVYVLFARDRYLVASENAARFISVIATRKGITVDEKLAANNDAVKMISTALESGILQKAS
ncbi:MAG: SPASM domain-containing protein, partial [Nanoarchaeota archaeon]